MKKLKLTKKSAIISVSCLLLLCILAGFALREDLKTVNFVLPYAQAGVLDMLYREANVKKAEYVETGIEIEAVVDPKIYGRIRDLLPEDQREPEHEEF